MCTVQLAAAARGKASFLVFWDKWDKKTRFLKNEPEKLLITKAGPPKTNRNEPKNEAEKLLKTRSGGKNEPKNEPTDVVENKEW